MDLPTKVYLATEVRIWTLAVAALLAAVSFGSTWAQTRWQAELSVQKEIASKERERESNERIANAQKDAALAKEKTATLEVQAEQLRKDNATLTERLAWRTLPTPQKETVENAQFPANSMLVITLGEMEAATFGEQIVAALTSSGVNVLKFTISTMSPPVYGVVYFESGWTPAAANILQQAGIKATKSAMPMLPIPASIAGKYAGIPVILVGLKPPP